MQRLIGLTAGAVHLALPLLAVRQIEDLGASATTAPPDAGPSTQSLAALIGQPADASQAPARLWIEGTPEPVRVSACRLRGILDVETVHPLASTVVTEVPGLVRGWVFVDRLYFVVDPDRLVARVPSGEPASAPGSAGRSEGPS